MSEAVRRARIVVPKRRGRRSRRPPASRDRVAVGEVGGVQETLVYVATVADRQGRSAAAGRRGRGMGTVG